MAAMGGGEGQGGGVPAIKIFIGCGVAVGLLMIVGVIVAVVGGYFAFRQVDNYKEEARESMERLEEQQRRQREEIERLHEQEREAIERAAADMGVAEPAL